MPSPAELLHDPRFHGRWRLLLALLCCVAGWFAFAPRAPSLAFENADKLNHLLAFGSMAGVGSLGWIAGRRTAARVALGLLGYGAFIELVQSQIPGRTAAWDDLLADAVGIAGGLLLAALLRRTWPGHR